VLTNPPFAGSVKESQLLHQYDLARKPDGKWKSAVDRDILFIERNLEFLKPGGRMAVVLPQGLFNNFSDQYVRDFVGGKARILAVVGLHPNTFKPHTPTKTSVLFLQKWNDDPERGPLCPRVDDYPVFFAVSQRGGKDNRGDYIYEIDVNGKAALDEHGHLIVKHDLQEIAAAFADWAAEQAFSFATGDE
jgi:type I restriction enzyme M protein